MLLLHYYYFSYSIPKCKPHPTRIFFISLYFFLPFFLLSVFVVLLPFLLSSFLYPFLSTSTISCTNSTEDYGFSIQFNLRHNKVSLWHKIYKLKSSSNKGKEQNFYCRTRFSLSKQIIPDWCFSLFPQFRQIISLSYKSSVATQN